MKPRENHEAPDRIFDEVLKNFLGYGIRRASNVIQADLAEALRPFDLRMITFSSLVLITDNPGLTQTQLASALDIERSNLVSIVDELEKRGLIRRTTVTGDRRAYALTATLAGCRLKESAYAAALAHENRLLSMLSPEQREIVRQAMAQILAQS